jgi:hypothetical protein
MSSNKANPIKKTAIIANKILMQFVYLNEMLRNEA